jgi:hypothetical protein
MLIAEEEQAASDLPFVGYFPSALQLFKSPIPLKASIQSLDFHT